MREVLERLGAPPEVAADVTSGVLARYAEPHRRYHTGEHLDEVLAEVARLAPMVTSADVDAVVLAAWFHDAVYDPGAPSGRNEEDSAVLAVAELRRAGIEGAIADEVARLVRLTARHAVEPADGSGALLVDADLCVLASPPERYERYVTDVRAEYAAVDEVAWRTGRAAVLRTFLADGELFRVGDDVADRRRRAYLNLSTELATLGTPG